ncbi:MAG: hypothetical protein H0Z24_03225 [Thermosipho sp. (in: Bacteria)]|nr:hypothetical protein [Thermosipho sp. (in: thermotogales)]
MLENIRRQKQKEGKLNSLTRKALFKLNEQEIREAVEGIRNGEWYDPEPEEVYVSIFGIQIKKS